MLLANSSHILTKFITNNIYLNPFKTKFIFLHKTHPKVLYNNKTQVTPTPPSEKQSVINKTVNNK